MSELGGPWISCAVALPLLAFTMSWMRWREGTLRALSAVASAGALAMTIACLIDVSMAGGALRADPWDISAALGGDCLLMADELSAWLLPFASLLWLIVLVVLPRDGLVAGGLRRMMLGQACILALLSCRHPIALAALWIASIVIFLSDHAGPSYRRVRRLADLYLGASAVLFAGGAIALELTNDPWAVAPILIAILIRKGIVPCHSWMPELFERGRLASTILFSAPQIGAYTSVVLLLPRAPAPVLVIIGALSLATAVYGAAASLVQRKPRRAFGYLFMSQSALVMAGLDATSVAGLAGGLCMWISSGLALAGFGLTIRVLEARRGPLELSRLNGGYESMPLLASSFLLLGLASVGFPGTLGYVGEELLVDGAIQQFTHIGFAVVIATALNGICVLRMYFSLFCGARGRVLLTPIRPRKLVAFVALTAILLAGGLAPRPIVTSRTRAARQLLESRAIAAPQE